jgi:hypothetical protein
MASSNDLTSALCKLLGPIDQARFTVSDNKPKKLQVIMQSLLMDRKTLHASAAAVRTQALERASEPRRTGRDVIYMNRQNYEDILQFSHQQMYKDACDALKILRILIGRGVEAV